MSNGPKTLPEQSASRTIRQFFYADVGLAKTLEALRAIAFDEAATLTHKQSGVSFEVATPEERLSVIASGLGPAIRHLQERPQYEEGDRRS